MSFERLLQPRSIAVFGGGAAEEVIRQCELVGYQGELWPVHPKKSEVLGRPVFRSVEELPGSPDAAYVAVNRELTIGIVEALAASGAGGAVCYATGFTEAGDEGVELERRLLGACGDMPLVGPNCYGLLNYVDGALLWPDQQGGRRVDQGIALITMSSNVAFNLTMQRRGLPIAYVVSLGNQLKFDLEQAIRTFARQDRVTAIGLYLEAVPDPRAFEAAVGVARELGKPIVALKSGRSEVAQRIVLSHTASLAGSDQLVEALFERAGVARVGSLEELIEALKVLHVLGPLPGGRVGSMSTSGGDLSLLGDAMAGSSLGMPPLSDGGRERIGSTVHERIVVANPLDYQMFDWNDEEPLTTTFTAFLEEGFDVSLCLLDYPRDDKCDPATWGGAERGFIRAAQATGAKSAVLSTFTDTMPERLAERLIELGIAPLAGIETGLAGLRAAVEIGASWSRQPGPPLLPEVEVKAGSRPRVLDEAASKAVLAGYGVPVPRSRVVATPSEAARAAAEIGFPVVVKALGLGHKTEAGGVVLNLADTDAVASAAAEMSGLADRFLVEQMVQGGVAELIVGVARDEQFGPYLVVGAGGILVELLKDSRSLLLPVTRAQVLRALCGLACAPLLEGFRGRPRADMAAAADAVLAIARWVEDDPGSVVELDVNPLILFREDEGVVAADALLSRREVEPTENDDE
jgi:acyl-CoA synthetase (NDP forming)